MTLKTITKQEGADRLQCVRLGLISFIYFLLEDTKKISGNWIQMYVITYLDDYTPREERFLRLSNRT